MYSVKWTEGATAHHASTALPCWDLCKAACRARSWARLLLGSAEIATLLQTLPNRHALVAIGQRVLQMETVDLNARGDRVSEAEERKQQQQIKAQMV
jgi:hypothetical protein